MVLDPDFTKGRPYMYVQYYPYWGGEQGKDTDPKLGTGFDRRTYKGEKRISRFTYDDATKTFVPGSEKVIFSYIVAGLQLLPQRRRHGLRLQGQPVRHQRRLDAERHRRQRHEQPVQQQQRRLHQPGRALHAPVPRRRRRRRTAATSRQAERPADTGPLISYGDARGTSGNTNVYEGKIIRIKPLANPGDTPGVGSTYTIPDADAPNGANLFAPDSQPVKDGKAKPEIFAMGVRSNYTIHIDKKTDAITTAWIGPDQGAENGTWGPAKTENATMMNSAGNWGWPFCQAGNRWSYRAKTASLNGGNAAPFGHPGHGRRRRRRPDRRLLRLPRRDPQRLAVQHGPARRSPRPSR